MRTIVKYAERKDDLPLLQLFIHGAPHRRVDIRLIERFRQELVEAARKEMIVIPIRVPIAISVLFIDPTSVDLDNLITALWRAMDGTSHRKPTLLADDSLVWCIEKAAKYYPNGTNREFLLQGLRH